MAALSQIAALDSVEHIRYPRTAHIDPITSLSKDLFNFIEQELLECETDLPDPVVGYSQNYGHASKSAAWAILSRLYLNAEEYINQPKYTECITYCKK